MSREWRAILAVLAIFATGFVGYRYLFGTDGADRFRVVQVSGEVDHVRAGGETVAAQEGTRLAEGDRVVSQGGTAVLGLGDGAKVTLEPQASVQVLGVSREGVRLELEGGKIQATVRPGSGRVGVAAGGREVTASDADFTVATDGEGALAIAAQRGALSVSGLPGIDEVNEGEELVAPRSGAPLKAPASEALLLFVQWPEAPRTRASQATVAGKTQPNARVEVRGGSRVVTAKADANGNFTLTVPLAEGENRLAVVAVNLLGRSTEVSSAVVRDTTAPSVGVTLEF